MTRSELLITSRQNPRIVEARKLDQRKHRDWQGRFLAEGLQVLHMALDAGARPLEIFYCESQFTGEEAPRLLRRFADAGAEQVPVSPEVMQSLSERDVCQGIVATFAQADTRFESLALSGHELVVVLDRLQDPGNLGTLIRTADAVGAAAVALIEPSVDPFDRKTVRGSMGSLFTVPLARTGDVAGLFAFLRSRRLRTVGADPQRGAAWGDPLWPGGVALILGNEARGVSADVFGYVQAWVHLPIVGQAESLNVAVAGGVLMYAWLRANQRQQQGCSQPAANAQQGVNQYHEHHSAGHDELLDRLGPGMRR